MTSNTPKKRSPTRKDLLKELERIHSTLISGTQVSRTRTSGKSVAAKQSPATHSETNTKNDDIAMPPAAAPTEIADLEEEDIILVDEDSSATSPEQALPGQQSLFDEQSHAASDSSRKSAEPVQAKGENPFLPQHIREKLNKNRSDLLENMAGTNAALNITDGSQEESATAHDEDGENSTKNPVVEALVAKYMPIIEEELRARLEKQLDNDKDA